MYTLPFTVAKESVISVQLGYDFLLADMSFSIAPASSSSLIPTRYGLNHYNQDDLTAFLDEGSYNLVISGSLPWNLTMTGITLPCVEFDLRISISLLGSHADRVDCTSYGLLPWDLNSDLGGSAPYGGPIRFGSLNMWYDRFLLNSNRRQLRMKFRLTQPSTLNLFINERSWTDIVSTIYHLPAGVHVDDKDALTEVVPAVAFADTFFQESSIYAINASDLANNRDYVLQLEYRPTTFDTCSSFGLGIALLPNTEIVGDLELSCSDLNASAPASARWPPAVITNPLTTVIGSFTREEVNQKTQNGLFQHEVLFSVKTPSLLDVSLSYNALASFFRLKLYIKDTDGTWRHIITGDWSPISAGQTFLGLTQELSHSPSAGDYKLVIEQPKLPALKEGINKKQCFPFMFVFHLQSGDSSSGPLVRRVEPPSAERADPTRDLYVEVRFSQALYTASGTAITRNANKDALTNAFVLKNTDGSVTIKPAAVSAPLNNPLPDDNTRWLFQFNHGSLPVFCRYSTVS